MERHAATLLDVWREVCRHIEIGDSVERVAPLLASRLPADLLLVRHLDVPRSHLETVATGFCHPETVSLRLKTECPQADLDKIVSFPLSMYDVMNIWTDDEPSSAY